jgi:lipid-A-disaccharide synthase
MTTLLLSAGDASGELHTAPFVEAFRKRVPDARFLGLGGTEMEKAGVELVVHQRELAIGGLVEVLRDAGRIVSVWRRMKRALETSGADLVVLVDSPDFNIPLARRAKKAGIPVLYFISPQVWAWRRRRIGKIARRVDRMAVIFPFEKEVYAKAALQVDFVGHPLVDRLGGIALQTSRQEMRRSLGLDPGGYLVVMLPGSRRNEVREGLSAVATRCAKGSRSISRPPVPCTFATRAYTSRSRWLPASRGPVSSGPSPRPAFPRSSRSRSSRGVPTS